jgi:hypothetical protein
MSAFVTVRPSSKRSRFSSSTFIEYRAALFEGLGRCHCRGRSFRQNCLLRCESLKTRQVSSAFTPWLQSFPERPECTILWVRTLEARNASRPVPGIISHGPGGRAKTLRHPGQFRGVAFESLSLIRRRKLVRRPYSNLWLRSPETARLSGRQFGFPRRRRKAACARAGPAKERCLSNGKILHTIVYSIMTALNQLVPAPDRRRPGDQASFQHQDARSS